MDAQTVLKLATIKGAQVLGLRSSIGSLAIGKKADLIIIDTARPHLTPMYNPISHMVYAARGSDVTTVIIDGTLVMADRQLKTMNLDSVIDDVNRIAQDIMAK